MFALPSGKLPEGMLCRRDGIGRRAGLKIPWWQHRMGSTPIAGTIHEKIDFLNAGG